MSIDLDDTIAALASAPGGALRGIIRISGDVLPPLESLFQPPDALRDCRVPTRIRGCLACPHVPGRLPAELQLWPTPRSYTGQPMAELHLIGSPPLLEAVLETLFTRGVRSARTGEFTLRAFLAGRLDLVQAEGVLGVVDAREEKQLQRALNQLAGGTSTEIGRLRGRLLDLLSELEAGLDFADEEIEFLSPKELSSRIENAQAALTRLADRADRRTVSGGSPRVVLAGLPNAGKSTLFNALLERDAALVSEVSGTTRDYLRARTTWSGTTVELLDTAGWEAAPADLDASAQEHRAEQAEQADLLIWCTAADFDRHTRRLDEAERTRAEEKSRAFLHVITKSDTTAPNPKSDTTPPHPKSDTAAPNPNPPRTKGGPGGVPTDSAPASPPCTPLTVSALTGEGLDPLKETILAHFGDQAAPTDGLLGTTAARCAESLTGAGQALERAHDAARLHAGEELVAVELRDALEHLGRIVGAVYTDDILDRIFSKFCIGK